MDMANMPPAKHIKFVLAGAISKAEKLKKQVGNAASELEYFDGLKAFLETIPEGQEEMFFGEMNQAFERVKQTFSHFKWSIFSCYWIFTEPETFDGLLTETEALCSSVQDDLYTCFDIKIVVNGDALFIKMPLLWSRYETRTAGPKWSLTKDNMAWFARELEAEFSKKFDEIPTYIKRHISYLNVIPTARKVYPDNDNYDTKKVTDIISLYMGGTDNAMTTSFSFYSIHTDDIPPGTYVVVTPDHEISPSMGALQEGIKQAFSGL